MPFDRLIDNIKAKNNPTVAGLDPKPVSYTHLDVYKRQVLERLPTQRNTATRAAIPWRLASAAAF